MTIEVRQDKITGQCVIYAPGTGISVNPSLPEENAIYLKKSDPETADYAD